MSDSGGAEPGANGAPGAATTSPTPTPAAMADNASTPNQGATSGATPAPGASTPAGAEGGSMDVPLAPAEPAPSSDADADAEDDGNASGPATDEPGESPEADDPSADDPRAEDPADDDPRAEDPAGDQDEPAPPDPPPPASISFGADVYPILVENCGRCHASGRLPNLASANQNTAFDVAVRESDEIVELIEEGEMPADSCSGRPGSNGCVSVADFGVIERWVAAGRPR